MKPKKTIRKSFRITESCDQQLKYLAESTFRSETNVIEMLVAQADSFSLMTIGKKMETLEQKYEKMNER